MQCSYLNAQRNCTHANKVTVHLLQSRRQLDENKDCGKPSIQTYKWRRESTNECIIVSGLLWAPLIPSCKQHRVCVALTRGQRGNQWKRFKCLNAVKLFSDFHWWTVSFQPFNYLHTHTHGDTGQSGHRYNVLCLTLALWPVILKCCCIVSRWGGQDGGLTQGRKSRPEERRRRSRVRGWLIYIPK